MRLEEQLKGNTNGVKKSLEHGVITGVLHEV